MKRETTDLIRRLSGAEWFSEAGKPVEQAATDVLVVGSWDEAVGLCSTKDWANYRIYRANVLTMHLHHHARDAFMRWNDIVDEVKAETTSLISTKLEPVIASHWLPKAFDSAVQWDLLHACMESEYSDARPPNFYLGLAEWYERGRFPCGWGQRRSDGTVVHVEVPSDLSPDDPTYFERVVFFTTRWTPMRQPEGQLIVF